MVTALNAFILLINLYRIRHFLPRFSATDSHHHKTALSVNAHDDNSAPGKLEKIIKNADPEIL